MTVETETRHASAVALSGRAVLITGPSGSGKSGLALALMAFGASLITDDRARISLSAGRPYVNAPERLAGVIEARGVGLLKVPYVAGAPLALVVDMETPETARLPLRRHETVLGQQVPCIRRVDAAHFPGAIVALMEGDGWWSDD